MTFTFIRLILDLNNYTEFLSSIKKIGNEPQLNLNIRAKRAVGSVKKKEGAKLGTCLRNFISDSSVIPILFPS